MRILHSVHDYLPEHVAGVEVYTSRLLSGQRHEDDVGLISARLDPDRESGDLIESRVDGIEVFEVVQNRDWWKFEHTWLDRRLKPSIRTTFARFEPDVLHVQHLMNLTLALIEVANEMRVPIIMTLHDHWWSCANGGQRFHPDRTRCDHLDSAKCGTCTWSSVGPASAARAFIRTARRKRPSDAGDGRPTDASSPISNELFRGLSRGLARHCPTPFGSRRIERRWNVMRNLSNHVERFLAPSRDMAEAAIEFGLPADRIQILAHGFPIPEKLRSRRAGVSAEYFGYLGSLVPHKGVHHLLAAFETMPAGARLSIYGSLADDPGYVRELRAIAKHPGVRFLGPLEPESVPEALSALDCLIAPSIWRENAPLAIQEAFLVGTPVIATDLGGHRELLEKGGGLLVPPGDVQALQAAMRRLTSENGLSTRLARSAPSPYSIGEHVSDLREIYRRAIATSVGAGHSLDASRVLRNTPIDDV